MKCIFNKNLFLKLFFFLLLIINAVNECARKNNSACANDYTCEWEEEVPAKCTPKENIMASNCSAANTNAST